MVILPLFLITSALIHETLSIYKVLNTDEIGIEKVVRTFELQIQAIVPSFDLDISEYAKQSAAWLAGSLAAFFAGTASTIFHLFIAILGAFYLFKDGKKFTKSLIRISPLPDNQDEIIMNRMATAVRSVATGTVLVALIQGTLTAFGFWLFGFDRAILWGVVAAFGALIPGIGTTIVFGPAIAYLAYIGALPKAIGLAVWGMLAVGLIDNLLGPYLMSRGHNMHPFLILLSVLGGVMIFGPIGFIVGPVIISLFAVLLEIYLTHISDHSPK